MRELAARPNLLLFVSHDAGDYLGCYGRPAETPNLDTLADQGTLFVNHFATSPMCSPARGSLITGTYPHTNGLMGLVNLGWSLPETSLTDARRFSRAGYETYLVGLHHEKKAVSDLGFDRVLDVNYGSDAAEVAHAAEALLRDLGRERERGAARPFYMRLGTVSAHRMGTDPAGLDYGWPADEGGMARGVEVFPQWQDTTQLRSDLAGFAGEMKRLDCALGVILDALAEAGLADDTIVAYTSDHGIDFPCAKGTLYDLGIKSACILRVPGHKRAIQGLSSHIDVLPTLLELCAIDGCAGIEGISFAGEILGRGPVARREIFAEETTFPKDLMRCIRTERFKLILNIHTGRKSNAPVSGPVPIQGASDYYIVDRPPVELYDLEHDPHELRNLAGMLEYTDVEAELTSRLRTWMHETSDPAVVGKVNRPHDEQELLEALPPFCHTEHFELLWK